MKTTINMTTSTHDTDRYKDIDDLRSFYKSRNIDGLELMFIRGYDIPEKITRGDIIGIHLSYYTRWVNYWRGEQGELDREWFDELKRPRIDVTVRISGVMRDTWPHAVDMMDDAVIMVSALDEDVKDNYIKLNISKMENDFNDRSKTIRIFGDPPGTYGAGVDLALKASAWKNDDDLARYFIASSSFAYGNDLHGRKSIREFIHNAKSIDLSCETTSSRRMDTLSCGFGLEVQGGYKLVAKTLGKKNIRQYQSNNELNRNITTNDFATQIESDIKDTLLNMFWKRNRMDDGYDGASAIMHRIQNVFETQCLSDCVSDEILNEITENMSIMRKSANGSTKIINMQSKKLRVDYLN